MFFRVEKIPVLFPAAAVRETCGHVYPVTAAGANTPPPAGRKCDAPLSAAGYLNFAAVPQITDRMAELELLFPQAMSQADMPVCLSGGREGQESCR